MAYKIEADKHSATGSTEFTHVLTTRGQQAAVSGSSGFTLVELVVVCAVLGALVTMALPTFSSYIKAVRVTRCSADIRTIDKAIAAFVIEKNYLPDLLSDLAIGDILDPWQHPFEYHNLDIAVNPAANPLEDIATNALNTDYDLYSKGEDGAGTPATGDPGNADDIVRSNDGVYVGERP